MFFFTQFFNGNEYTKAVKMFEYERKLMLAENRLRNGNKCHSQLNRDESSESEMFSSFRL